MTNKLFLLLFSVLFFIATAAPPQEPLESAPPLPPTPINCSDELVSFSICLPYISSPPNNITEWPSHQCCDDVTSAFISGTSVCLCYFVQKPLILGFPLNSTRLYSLTSLCPMADQGTRANLSLISLCSGSHSLPPLRSITGPGQTKQNASDNIGSGSDNSPPPPSDVAQEETDVSDTTDTAADDDYEIEPRSVDGFEQQESPAARLDGNNQWKSFAWKGQHGHHCMYACLVVMIAVWVYMYISDFRFLLQIDFTYQITNWKWSNVTF